MPILPGKEGEDFRMEGSARSKKAERGKSSPHFDLITVGKGWMENDNAIAKE